MTHRTELVFLLLLASGLLTGCKPRPSVYVSIRSGSISGKPDHRLIRIEEDQAHSPKQILGAVLVRGKAVEFAASHTLLKDRADQGGRIQCRDVWSGLSDSDPRLVFEFVANVKQGYLEAAGKRYALKDHLVLVLSQEEDKVSRKVLELHPASFATEEVLAALADAEGRKPQPGAKH